MLIARVADAYAAEGVSYKRQREIYAEAGYEVSERTLRRHRACEDEGQPALSSDKGSGRPKALTDQQIMIFVGWVLNQNEKNVFFFLFCCLVGTRGLAMTRVQPSHALLAGRQIGAS
jgi:transposase